MRKIPTLFRRDPDDMRRVLPEVTPGCEWVLAGEGVATRKVDGTCTMLDREGRWWARREVKAGKPAPRDFREVEHDSATGKTVGWVPTETSPFAKFHAEALDGTTLEPGTYELCGPKINGNPEGLDQHRLIRHGSLLVVVYPPLSFERIRDAVLGLHEDDNTEGIVWHHPDGRMAKIKARDFPASAVARNRKQEPTA